MTSIEEGGQQQRPLLLGHRGSRREVAENTFAAFDKALRDGCDGFEFDLRLSADCRLVVCHDPQLQGLEIASASFAQLSSASPQKLPCLEEVLAKYGQRAFLDIELKVAGLEQATLELLRQHTGFCLGAAAPACPGVVISSFLPEVLHTLAQLQPQECPPSAPSATSPALGESSGTGLPQGFIFSSREKLRGWERLPVSHLMPRCDLLDRALLSEFQAAGKRVFAWTVNGEREMRRLAEMGVDGLISDDTQLLARCKTWFDRQL